MKLKYSINKNIPKLAWYAEICKGQDTVIVECGDNIEYNEEWFVEGAWCGDFREGAFTNDIFFLGTGAILRGDTICFATPGHTLERIYIIKSNGKLALSNSLSFVLERMQASLDFDYLEYEKAFHSILNGLDVYQKKIPLSDKEKELWALYYCNIEVDSKLNVKLSNKRKTPMFASFTEYYQSLLNDLQKLKENIQAEERKIKYGIVTTISSGYDSAACAVVAKKMGCDIAVTFTGSEKYVSDDGSDIARKLGYSVVVKKNAEAYKTSNKLVEAEYIAGGELGTGIVFSAFDEEFKNNLVLIGEGGDHIWDRNAHDVNDVVRFSDELYSGTTLIEPRLRLGYIYLPLPMYCATSWSSIYAISNSSEMKKWSLQNNYDRPIPRRIVEEAGIKRKDFGVGKKGAGFNYRYDTMNRLKKRMSENSFETFKEYYKENSCFTLRRLVKVIKYFLHTIPDYGHFFLRKCGIKLRKAIQHKNYQENPMAPAYLFLWSIEEIKKRYRK